MRGKYEEIEELNSELEDLEESAALYEKVFAPSRVSFSFISYPSNQLFCFSKEEEKSNVD